MRYLFGVLFPLLLQVLLIWILVEANTGNGSWVGLGAFLIGLFAVPATALVNLVYLRRNRERSLLAVLPTCLLLAAVTPLLVLLMSIV